MSRLQITETMLVGHDGIDAEHRIIVDLFNEFYILNDAGDKAGSKAKIAELSEVLVSHLEHEEKIMEDLGYRHVRAHEVEHSHFLDQFNQRVADMEENGSDSSSAEQLLNVLLKELISADMGIKAFLE